MRRYALDIYFRSVMYFILTILALFIFGSELSARTYAYVVADARDGKIINSHNSRQIVHPASLTKMMTLYLAFDAIRYGRLKLDQKVIISKNAASEPPSKFWYKPGQRVSIRYLIRASAIRSANDAATALGEAISGSEKIFISDMNKAAKKLLGEQDFSSFRASGCQSKSVIRRIYKANVTRKGNYLIFEVTANAFLLNMIRIIVGTLIKVGKNEITPEDFENIIKKRDRKLAGRTIEAKGLYFVGPEYNNLDYKVNKVFVNELD